MTSCHGKALRCFILYGENPAVFGSFCPFGSIMRSLYLYLLLAWISCSKNGRDADPGLLWRRKCGHIDYMYACKYMCLLQALYTWPNRKWFYMGGCFTMPYSNPIFPLRNHDSSMLSSNIITYNMFSNFRWSADCPAVDLSDLLTWPRFAWTNLSIESTSVLLWHNPLSAVGHFRSGLMYYKAQLSICHKNWY